MKIGNSWLIIDLSSVFCDQRSDDAIALRDSRSRHTDHISSVMDNYALFEWEPADDYYEGPEEEVDFAEGIYGTRGDDQTTLAIREDQTSHADHYDDDQECDDAAAHELEKQFGSLEEAETYVSDMYGSA